MLGKTADYVMRSALMAAMTAYGVAPATAAIMPQTSVTTTEAEHIAPVPEPVVILAQSVDRPSRSRPPESRVRERDSGRIEHPLTRITTRKVILDIDAVRRECGGYDEVYRLDCLRQGIEMVAAALPDNSEYREAKQILAKASGELGSIVSSYQDRSAPKLDVPQGANPRFKKRRKYTAIKREAVSTAMAKATDVVNEAATELLRSGENSERRYAHYQDISVAVDSTKALLRSS